MRELAFLNAGIKITLKDLRPDEEGKTKEPVSYTHLDLVKNRDFDVLVILGAGDLDNYVPQITKILEEK